MNERQRVLIVVALGFALAVVAGTWIVMLNTTDDGGGWFAYAPGTAAIFADRPSHAFRDGVIAFVAVVAWAGVSFWILRSRSARDLPET